MPAEKEGKKKRKPGKSTVKYKKYQVSGDAITRAGRICPKCGPAVFMATHKNRYHCGKCGYSEFIKS